MNDDNCIKVSFVLLFCYFHARVFTVTINLVLNKNLKTNMKANIKTLSD